MLCINKRLYRADRRNRIIRIDGTDRRDGAHWCDGADRAGHRRGGFPFKSRCTDLQRAQLRSGHLRSDGQPAQFFPFQQPPEPHRRDRGALPDRIRRARDDGYAGVLHRLLYARRVRRGRAGPAHGEHDGERLDHQPAGRADMGGPARRGRRQQHPRIPPRYARLPQRLPDDHTHRPLPRRLTAATGAAGTPAAPGHGQRERAGMECFHIASARYA